MSARLVVADGSAADGAGSESSKKLGGVQEFLGEKKGVSLCLGPALAGV